MCLCTLCTGRFLAATAGSDELDAFRVRHGLSAGAAPRSRGGAPAVARWVEAAEALPGGVRERVAREQEAVLRLASPLGTMHLVAAAGEPPSAAPAGPLALSMLRRRPDLFWDVARRHRRREPDVWLAGRGSRGAAPGDDRSPAASDALGRLLRRPVRVEFHRLPAGAAFVAHGASSSAPPGPSQAPLAQLVHYFGDGTVLFQAPSVPPDAARAAVDGCAAALGLAAPAGTAFDLGRLATGPVPLATADGVRLVRVRALRLSGPPRDGGPSVTLRAFSGDAAAMGRLLADHVRPINRGQLRVSHAELHLRLPDGVGARDLLVRLWPDRCDLGPGPDGDRALAALRFWGL